MTHSKDPTTCRRYEVDNSFGEALHEIVRTYLEKNAESEARYLQFYKIQKSLGDAVSKAAMAELPSGRKFQHQWRIPREVLEKSREALLKLNYAEIKTFDTLHTAVLKATRQIRGIGRLTAYDTAHRIGAYL